MDNNSLNFFLTTPPLQKGLGIDQSSSAYVVRALVLFANKASVSVDEDPSS